jgi:GNAT superfamily N-acetyltransferase
MIIRKATQEDNQQLIELQRKCPMGSDLLLQLDSSPDFFNRSRGYKNWNLLVAEEDGQILGAAGYAVQNKPIGGETYSMVYEYGFMVDPEARRKGIASLLQREIEKRTVDADYMHLNITEDNAASHSFFTGNGFQPVKRCSPIMVMAYKEHQVEELKIRKMREGDIPVVVELLNETYDEYDFYEPFTEDSFRDHYRRLPFYSINDIYLFEQDTVLAVAGVWDYDKVMKFTMLGFNTKWKMMRIITKVMGLFSVMPKMLGVGEQMSNWYLTPLGFRDPDAARQLLGYLLNLANKEDIGMISLPMDADSPIKEILSGYRYGEGNFIWYMKSSSGKELPDMSSKTLFVDVKDV